MAIDSTRGLPSFSEMYSAFKNKGGLGDAINAGVSGYMNAKEAVAKEDLQAAEAAKNRSEAVKNATPKEGVIRIDQILDPQEKQALSQYATPNAEGILVVPLTTYNAITKRGQGQEAINLKNQLVVEQSKRAEEASAHQARLAKVAEEKAALQAQLGPQAQQLSATRTLAEEAGKVEKPKLIERGISGIKEAFGGQPLASVLSERQGEAARAKLAEIGKVGPQSGEPLPKGPVMPNPVDEANGMTFNSKIPTVNSTDEFNALPAGSQYYDSYGNLATKPGKKR